MRVRPIDVAALIAIALLATACGPTTVVTSPTPTHSGSSTSPFGSSDACPAGLAGQPGCFTPHALRVAYGVEPLIGQGLTGKGVTVIDIVSYGSPALQQDFDTFSQQFGLPHQTLQIVAPLGTTPDNPNNKDIPGWGEETTLDVEMIHAIAPEANIVVMTSPVDETEGIIGLPQFLKLEQYAVQHHLGQIFSQSWTASEATLGDSASQQFLQTYASFYQQAATQDGITTLSGSGDQGATDYADLNATTLATTRTVNFPVDLPWVTAVGGTRLTANGASVSETAWQGSGGGVSKFYPEPSFQQGLSAAIQTTLSGHRGLPDVAAAADPATSLAYFINGQWTTVGGTSAATPLVAGIVALADQKAGHGLGNINPAIYQLGLSSTAQQDFRDITSGDNTNGAGGTTVQGFPAVPGWDPITGWGAPLADHFVPDLVAAVAHTSG
ncbi:MAG TPA: S53 family peptidase [Ktedonobacterales bacterium]|nr:S53 family peptidase [Ktedonobacterales bacterium]